MLAAAQPKNWFTVLLVYVIVLIPDKIIPEVSNPTVESTVIIEDPTDTGSITLVFGMILKLFKISIEPESSTNN